MNRYKGRIKKLEKKLFSVWHPAAFSPGQGWQDKLMRDIRLESIDRQGRQIFPERTAFRFAIAAGVAALILFAHSIYSGIVPEIDISTLFVFDPGGCLISPPFSLV